VDRPEPTESGARRGLSMFAGLHVLADADPRWPLDPVTQAAAASRGGAQVIQLRAKSTPDQLTLEWARAIRIQTRACGAAFVMNDRFDLALACEADAVHLGQDDLPPASIPAEARARLAVGRSTHTLEQARAAMDEDVDYVAYGPLFGTQSKQSEYAARGLDRLAEIVACVTPKPVVAIGGISLENIAAVLEAGAVGAAVISAAAAATEPEQAVASLVDAIERGGPPHG
jgi:thiamine-phosphate pyrophosphorylase